MLRPRLWTTSHNVLVAITFALLIVSTGHAQPQETKSKSPQSATAPPAAPPRPAVTSVRKRARLPRRYLRGLGEDSALEDDARHARAARPTRDAKAATARSSAHVAGGGDKTKIFIFKDHSSKGDQRSLSDLPCIRHASTCMRSIPCTRKTMSAVFRAIRRTMRKKREFLLVKSQPQLCYSCHLQQKPQFDMPFHHRVNEGLVQCTDCHNPHGTVARQTGTHIGGTGCGLFHLSRR